MEHGDASQIRQIVGLGSLTLDIVFLKANEPGFPFAGGTMGNILTILSALGWRSFPVASIGDDNAADIVISDLGSFGVDLTYIERDEHTSTPICLETLHNKSASAHHIYHSACIVCGNQFPAFTPPSTPLLTKVSHRISNCDVLFIDRQTDEIAKTVAEARKKVPVVMFEPSAAMSREAMLPLIHIANIVKYADDCFSDLGKTDLSDGAIEIQTLGSSGLRFRIARGDWNYCAARAVHSILDTAGCGDWVTAGLLDTLVRRRRVFHKADLTNHLDEAIENGQKLAAFACGFVGPRGGMYFDASRNKAPNAGRDESQPEMTPRVCWPQQIAIAQVCAGCREGHKGRH